MQATFSRTNFRAEGRRQLKKIRDQMRDDKLRAIDIMTNSVVVRTPVYTGKTLVNFRWSADAPILAVRAPIAKPSLPGKTSDLPVGSEPRRDANASVVLAEAAALKKEVARNPFLSIFLTNNHENYERLEYGDSRTPPGGMTRAGEAKLDTFLRGRR